MRAWQRLSTFEPLKTLADPRRMAILKQLMIAPATLSQLGRALGEHPAWIRHHLKQLEGAGLVELCETRVSAGFLEKYYQSKAQAYFFQELLLPEKPGRNVMVISGSHDLALEMLAHANLGDLDVLVLPNGSLDGLVALRQGICMLAGCHLYDAPSGDFNAPFVHHFFPDQTMLLLTLAHREQGLIFAAGNPSYISGLADLARPELRFINRNRGSGTRLWLDGQLTRLGIPPLQVKGYTDEVSTHTAVGEAIQSGRAQVGLGIRAAAIAHGLGFLPLFQERYDLVLPEQHFHQPQYAPLFEQMLSGQFRHQVEGLGGYDLTHLGEQVTL